MDAGSERDASRIAAIPADVPNPDAEAPVGEQSALAPISEVRPDCVGGQFALYAVTAPPSGR
jgi:hypothetical protein